MRNRLITRSVLFFGEYLAAENSQAALDHWGENNASALDSAIQTAVLELFGIVFSDSEFAEKAGKDQVVELLNARGPQRIPGRLASFDNGRAIIVDKSGNLIAVPALRIMEVAQDQAPQAMPAGKQVGT